MTNPAARQCEIAWFSALCDDDDEFLGVPGPQLQSGGDHFRNIVLRAEVGGFDNILLPSGHQRRACQAEGIEAFIFSGYPQVNGCDMSARYVLPHIEHGPLKFGRAG